MHWSYVLDQIKRTTRKHGAMLLMMAFAFIPLVLYAQSPTPSPTPVVATDGTSAFLSLLVADIQGYGGMPWFVQVSAVILLIIASTKVNLINSMLWNNIPANLQMWVGPALGALAGLFQMLATTNGVFSWTALTAWALAGAGAPIIHELLDAVKLIPGIGTTYVAIINLIEDTLSAQKKQTSVSPH